MYKIYNPDMLNGNYVLNSFYESGENTLYKFCTMSAIKFEQKDEGIFCVQAIDPVLSEKLESVANVDNLGAIDLVSVLKDQNGIIGYEIKDHNNKHFLKDSEEEPFEVKKDKLIELYKGLRELHNYFDVENLSTRNILNSDAGLKIVNWDTPIYESPFTENAKKNDLIRMYLISLNYLYDIDFELVARKYGFEELLPILTEYKIDDAAATYLTDISIDNGAHVYFDEYLSEVKDIGTIKKKLLKQKIK